MKELAKSLFTLVSGIRCIPHVLLLLLPGRGRLVRTDVTRWRGARGETATWYGMVYQFLHLMTHSPQFRNVFYNRTGILGKLSSPLCPPMDTLYLYTKDIGPSLYIQHGFATIVAAKSVGANCWINQQVTIGYSAVDETPTLGDNVKVFAGAKIIGKVTIGNNSTIGANAVVVKDVPPNCTVVGAPAYIVRRDGVRVHEKL